MSRSTERTILELIATFLRRLTDRDIQSLIDGRARLVVAYNDPSADIAEVTDSAIETRLTKVARALQEASSRDEADAILRSSKLRSAELRKLMHILDLPVSRTDTVDRLHHKLVDSTVGFKIRSKAVRGNDEASYLPYSKKDEDPENPLS